MNHKEEEQKKKSALAEAEERILAYWEQADIFKKTLEKDAPQGDFVFFEGPPTANGRPGIHHLEARAFKDLIPRYKTMKGYRVRRKAGWDTHGLPVELEVEKKLGLKSKKEIEEYGVARFNEECKKSVWTYVDEWKNFTNRMGYWVDLENPYITYESNYIESLWSIIKKVSDDGLLYKDYKVVPWCPRCGTALSSHELAQGYEDVKDLSVTAKFKVVGKDNTYILAWTTTPWTLPGNVALAVGKKIQYVEVSVKIESGVEEYYILAKDRLALVENSQVIREYVGEDLVGLEYEPLYPYLTNNLPKTEQSKKEKAWKVYTADFVTTNDGTGVVHTAVMYGQDDFVLGTELGLPKFHVVDDTGHFIKEVTQFSGRFVKDEDVAIDIIKDLAHRGLLFKKEKYEHSYPFCWRCKTPLIYYARDSWYIRMSGLRESLMKENEGIHWEPNHIQKGRFGEWLSEVKDWAISRERYWGTPLPVWEGADGKKVTIGSIEELKKKTKSRNNHFVFIRHGESEHNVKNIVSSHVDDGYHLTEKGKEDIKKISKQFEGKKIDAVYASPFIRTKETAHVLCESLDFDIQNIQFDSRIQEYNFGDFHGKDFNEYLRYEEEHMHSYDVPISGGESYADAKQRFGQFLYEIDQRHQNETIFVVTHGIGLETISAVLVGADMKRSKEIIDTVSFEPGSVLSFDFIPIPHNELFELDLHKPYIDSITILDEEGNEMTRVKEVMDVWFDSGAMPFAENHYPFENKEEVDTKRFPADYISEAIDQTRGWFYTLHAVGVLMGKGKAYRNVICLGHILDKDGQKMSKSRGNAISPWDVIDQYGVDPLRFWMYTVNQPGESKNFDTRTVDDVVKKVFNLLSNVVQFYLLSCEGVSLSERKASQHPLDKWIMSKVNMCVRDVTQFLDEYKPLEAGRAIRDFIADLSQWYVRRSRDRVKEEGSDKDDALFTMREVILCTAKMVAPFTPFFAEEIYKKIQGSHESVHLENWPEVGNIDEDIVHDMEVVRDTVSTALELRARSGIKIRQPLSLLVIQSQQLEGKHELLSIIADEINVKEVRVDVNISEKVILDTHISTELREEGVIRDVIRKVQESRKNNNLLPSQVVSIRSIQMDETYESVVRAHIQKIQEVCNISNSDFVFMQNTGDKVDEIVVTLEI